MSYIFDALKKAEGERRLARVPTLDTVHLPAPRSPGGRVAWVVAVASLASAVALILLLRPGPTGVTSKVVGARGSVTAAPPVVGLKQAVPGEAGGDGTAGASGKAGRTNAGLRQAKPAASGAPASRPAPAGSKAVADRAGSQPEATLSRTTAAGTPSAETTSALQAGRPGSAGAPSDVRSTEGDVPRAPVWREPPPALQETASRMTLDVLVYSERDAERMVFINGRKYVEGQRVDGGFLVETIARDGAILNHNGRRFFLGPRSHPYVQTSP